VGRSPSIAVAIGALALFACPEPPQLRDEAAITYRAGFSAESGVTTKIYVPFPIDAAADEVKKGLTVTDGGAVGYEASDGGVFLTVSGRGVIQASYQAARSKAFGSAEIPDAQLSQQIPDAGSEARYMKVNKGGSATAQVDFEYTVSKDCGAGCGGQRSWTFQGPVGLSLQEISTQFVEESNR
jgi:hypothetical protein